MFQILHRLGTCFEPTYVRSAADYRFSYLCGIFSVSGGTLLLVTGCILSKLYIIIN
jgi:hypothetical protein